MKKIFILFVSFIFIFSSYYIVFASILDGNEEIINDNFINTITIIEKNLETQKEIIKSIEYNAINPNSVITTASSEIEQVDPFSIVGDDGRHNVNNLITPYSAICYISVTMPDRTTKSATGFMIGDNVCMTVAHAVEGAYSIQVFPGMDGSNIPFGSTYATTITMSTEFNNNDEFSMKHDWAILRLRDEIGDECGWLGLINYNSYLSLTGEYVGCSGYPTDLVSKVQYCAFDDVSYVFSQYFAHKVDIKGGQSGSPVFRAGDYYVVGIQSKENDSVPINFACRINDENFNVARDIINED